MLQVDSIVKVAQQAMQPKAMSDARSEHQLVVAEASQARKAYLQQIVESVHYLREHGIAGTAKQVESPSFGSLATSAERKCLFEHCLAAKAWRRIQFEELLKSYNRGGA